MHIKLVGGREVKRIVPIGSRGSKLVVVQAESVAARLREATGAEDARHGSI